MDYELDKATKYLHTYGSNFDGSCSSDNYMTLPKLYRLSKPALLRIGHKFNLTNFALPHCMGSNSLVIYANGLIVDKPQSVAIKISVQDRHFDNTELDRLQTLVSDLEIAPKIVYNTELEFGTSTYFIKIVVSHKVIPFDLFCWSDIKQMKTAAVTLLEKVLKLHTLGYVHNDIKRANFGLDSDGTVFLFDFDNFTKIKSYNCDVSLSTSTCHPPHFLRQEYIAKGLGSRAIDLFPVMSIILGDIFGVIFWKFNSEQFPEKIRSLVNFNRGKIYYWIQHNMSKQFLDYSYQKNPFWYSLTNLAHLFFKEASILRRRQFLKRASLLVAIMKTNI